MKKIPKLVLFFIVTCALIFIFGKIWPLGYDYYYIFRPVTEAFLNGKTNLYDTASEGFYNAPWAIFVFLPTIFLPVQYGQALLQVVQLLGLLFTTDVFIEDKNGQGNYFNIFVVVLALSNMHTFGLLNSGNIDGLLALGMGMGWVGAKENRPLLLGTGLWLLSIKPINIIFVAILLIKIAWDWSIKEKIKTLLPLFITVVASFPIFGLDWPVNYINAISRKPPNIYPQTSLWRLLSNFGIERHISVLIFFLVLILFIIRVLKTKQVNRYMLGFALSVNLVFSPYTLGSHYTMLAPIFVLISQRLKWMLMLWFLTFSPLLRIIYGFKMSWVDIIYPISILFATGFIIFNDASLNKKHKNLLTNSNK